MCGQKSFGMLWRCYVHQENLCPESITCEMSVRWIRCRQKCFPRAEKTKDDFLTGQCYTSFLISSLFLRFFSLSVFLRLIVRLTWKRGKYRWKNTSNSEMNKKKSTSPQKHHIFLRVSIRALKHPFNRPTRQSSRQTIWIKYMHVYLRTHLFQIPFNGATRYARTISWPKIQNTIYFSSRWNEKYCASCCLLCIH